MGEVVFINGPCTSFNEWMATPLYKTRPSGAAPLLVADYDRTLSPEAVNCNHLDTWFHCIVAMMWVTCHICFLACMKRLRASRGMIDVHAHWQEEFTPMID